jgi:broad specificity phosphatase PhoE
VTRLILIRHGETAWNHAQRIQGSTDIPLNDTGRAQAAATAEALRDEIDPAMTRLVSSDLSRARETAEIIGTGLALGAPRLYPALRERSYGDAEGLTAAEFHERWGEWFDADVPNAETRAQLRARALAGLQRVVADARRDGTVSQNSVVVVAHGALIREVIGHASGDEFPIPGERLANGSAHIILWERERLRLLSYAAV